MRRILSGALLVLLAALPRTAAAQERAEVRGRVTNPAGAPEAGVVIRIASLSGGTATAADGQYRLVIPNERIGAAARSVTITASRVGLATQSFQITLAPGAALTQNFQLATDALQLQEVVVTAAGTERRQR